MKNPVGKPGPLSTSINKVLLAHSHTHLCIVCGCFGARRTKELNSCDRDHMACKTENVYYLGLLKTKSKNHTNTCYNQEKKKTREPKTIQRCSASLLTREIDIKCVPSRMAAAGEKRAEVEVVESRECSSAARPGKPNYS